MSAAVRQGASLQSVLPAQTNLPLHARPAAADLVGGKRGGSEAKAWGPASERQGRSDWRSKGEVIRAEGQGVGSPREARVPGPERGVT